MKRNHKIAAVLALCLAGVAIAAPVLSIESVIRVFRAGLYVGSAGISSDTDNLLKESLGECTSLNFIGTDGGADKVGCDYLTISKTGAAIGDVCTATFPKNVDGGFTDVLVPTTWMTCQVPLANTIKVGLCAVGDTGNPDAGTVCVRTFSSQ